jgi:hypothetical protein
MFTRTKWTLRIAIFFSLLAAIIGQKITIQPANPAPDSKRESILRNTQKLRVEVRLDRAVYVAGESMNITLTVANPTNESLEVFDPFDARSTGFDVLEWRRDPVAGLDAYLHIDPHPVEQRTLAWDAPTTFIASGQTIQREVHSFDRLCERCTTTALTGGSAPMREGKYRIRFGYTHFGIDAMADFAVRFPVFRMAVSTEVRAEAPMAAQSSGSVGHQPVFVRAAVLDLDGEQIVVLSRDHEFGREMQASVGKVLDRDGVRHLAPFDRVDQGAGDVVIQKLAADADNNLTLEWKRGSQTSRIHTDPARSRMDRF